MNFEDVFAEVRKGFVITRNDGYDVFLLENKKAPYGALYMGAKINGGYGEIFLWEPTSEELLADNWFIGSSDT